jgi:hypothetical protein
MFGRSRTYLTRFVEWADDPGMPIPYTTACICAELWRIAPRRHDDLCPLAELSE